MRGQPPCATAGLPGSVRGALLLLKARHARDTQARSASEGSPATHAQHTRPKLQRRSPFGEFAYELVAAEQLTANDESGARETTKQTPTLRTARCWLRICHQDIARGDNNAARAAACAAAQILDRDGFDSFVAEDMALVASAAARAGEKEIAQELFHRALSLSDADKSPKSMHPFVASFQVHGGLLTDAYRTIQSIPKKSDRAQPLADLCLALGKAANASRNLRP
jgi:hypothetical protein